MQPDPNAGAASEPRADAPVESREALGEPRPREQGGPEGPEPTRFGDWERKGRCIDF
ncbi:MAG: DUF1674 domain-containing protein [Proteobacteria bacterium]|nr:MAG: DUF1674 domain-containing protein [Pseudomonadota bacterium]